MKICFVTEYFPTGSLCDIRGGAEAVAFYEAKYLSGNHGVEVITSFEPGTNREDAFDNLKVFRCGKTRSYVQKGAFLDRLSFILSAYNFCIKRKYDVVVGFNFLTYPVAWKISRRLNVPCIIRYHDLLIGRWIRNFGFMGLIGEVLERYILSRKLAAVVAVSNYTANNLKGYFHAEERIHIVHNGVEIPELTSIKADVPTVVCVSRLVKYKHVGDLVTAVSLLLKDFPAIQCKIIGTGSEEEKLKHLAMELGIEKHVSFLGFVHDHKELMNFVGSAHVACLPSSLEGFGIAILESMACSVPFVASEIPPILEVSDGKGGLFFECRNVEDLAGKIRLILNNSHLQNKLKEEGRERANAFLWSDLSQKTEAIYEKAMDEWGCRKER
ncbi:MAG: glycosyltransferase family 4 protein [Bacteroidota bacterium]